MKTKLCAMAIIALFAACGGDPETDPCADAVCEAWQTCEDGKCVGEDPCHLQNCSYHGECDNSSGDKVCVCYEAYAGDDCETCAEGYHWGADGLACTDDPCNPNLCDDGLACNGVETCVPATGCTNPPDQTCNGHGTCQEPDATCSCSGNWDPATDCGTCLIGWDIAIDCTTCATGYGGANCDPVPTISNLAIDLSTTGLCVGGGFTYPVSFNSTNATSWSVTEITSGTASPDSGTINGSLTTFDYISGGGIMIRITVQVDGSGGSASDFIEFQCF